MRLQDERRTGEKTIGSNCRYEVPSNGVIAFAHVLPMVSVPIEMNLSEMNIYHFISEGISHNLSRIRNPLFFFFSGFFFFRKLEEWNAGFYRSQLKKRIRSLLLPYLLWNILMIAAIYIKNYAVTSFLSMEPGEELSSLRVTPWYILFWHTPANYPMWFYAIYFVCPYWPPCSICFSGF